MGLEWESSATIICQDCSWNLVGIPGGELSTAVLIYRTTYFSLLSLRFLHLFKSVSQAVYKYCSNLHKYTLLSSFPSYFYIDISLFLKPIIVYSFDSSLSTVSSSNSSLSTISSSNPKFSSSSAFSSCCLFIYIVISINNKSSCFFPDLPASISHCSLKNLAGFVNADVGRL